MVAEDEDVSTEAFPSSVTREEPNLISMSMSTLTSTEVLDGVVDASLVPAFGEEV